MIGSSLRGTPVRPSHIVGTSRVIGDLLVVCKYRSALLDEENPRGASSAPPPRPADALDFGRHAHAGVPWRWTMGLCAA